MAAKPSRSTVKLRDPQPCPSCGVRIKLIVRGRCPTCLALVGPRRAAKLSGKEARRKRRALVRRDGAECRACAATEGLTIDHVVPAALGGSNALTNLQLLCADCNQQKADSVLEWREFPQVGER